MERGLGARRVPGRDHKAPSLASSFRSAIWYLANSGKSCGPSAFPALSPVPQRPPDTTTSPQLKAVCLPPLIFCHALKSELYRNLWVRAPACPRTGAVSGHTPRTSPKGRLSLPPAGGLGRPPLLPRLCITRGAKVGGRLPGMSVIYLGLRLKGLRVKNNRDTRTWENASHQAGVQGQPGTLLSPWG